MLDGVSLDQLRTFIAAADEGSFSAAGRRLRRAQSVVSQTLANLEGQLGVKLFERGARFTALSDQGRALLTEARAVAGHVDLFKARAKGLAGGLEPDLSVVTDAMFPIAPFIGAVSAFHERFAPTALRFYVESWGTVAQHVLDGRSSVGVGTSMTPALPRLTQEPLLTVGVPLVVSPRHPLASHRAPIPTAIFAEHIQLVHSESSTRSPAVQHRVLSPQTWLLTDLGAKHAFIRAVRVWRVAPAYCRGGSGERCACSDCGRRGSPRGPHGNHVGRVSDGQPSRPGGPLVYRSPQAGERRTTPKRSNPCRWSRSLRPSSADDFTADRSRGNDRRVSGVDGRAARPPAACHPLVGPTCTVTVAGDGRRTAH